MTNHQQKKGSKKIISIKNHQKRHKNSGFFYINNVKMK